MKRRTLVCGPWVGEFGFEVALFMPRVRFLHARGHKIIVACRPDSAHLYEDFAHRIFYFDTNTWECGGSTNKEIPSEMVNAKMFWGSMGFQPDQIRNWHGKKLQNDVSSGLALHKKYGDWSQERTEVLVHSRMINTNTKAFPHKEWRNTHPTHMLRS